ncbi:MAG: amidase family protein, partial [Candidatus Parcubacteria bacterium]|nr:amidase family protein [Candidatus Parcubacteria bacterium]
MITEISKQLNQKEISARDLVQKYLNNIESKDTDIQAYLSVFKEEALNQAQEIDKRRNKKESLSPLAGIPF